ncbi:MAG: glycosyltransferase [Phycisphaerales bacterium]
MPTDHPRSATADAPALNGEAHAPAPARPAEPTVPERLARTARRIASGRASWPYLAGAPLALPRTLPGGRPWPRISIVTPSYNQAGYIEETILSIRNQGYPNLEHIVMDGGSTDGTRDILDHYRAGFAHCVSEKDGGQSDALNRGFALATGEVLTWVNSDDQLAEGALGAVALAFAQSGADMVAGECHIFRDGTLVEKHLTSCAPGPLPLEDLLDIEGRWLQGQFFYQPEVMFTRVLWERAGAHVRTDLYHSMDYELWLRMAAAGARLHVIGRPVALFRFHEQQKTAGTVVGGFRVELPRARDAFLQRAGLSLPPSETAHPTSETRPRLRVALFNDVGFAYGAGIAHRRLAEALASAGHEVHAVAATTPEHHGAGAPRLAREDIASRIASFNPDLVVVGNLHGADVDPAILGLLAARWPTAFVLHDLWLLTGRCAYAGGCRRYLEGCDRLCSCPTGHPALAPDQVRPAWEAKRLALSSAPGLALWANSDWALARAREALGAPGALRGPAPVAIRFGFELDTFRPRDKGACRDVLGLPRDRFIIMTSASSVSDPRKGLAHLARAMDLLRLDDALVAAVGWFADGESPPIPGMRAMGYMQDAQRLAMLYAAADLFVGPSLEEAFGQVYIEAAACGTPSVGYPVGGKPEAILDGLSGRLARGATSEALAEAIDELYRQPALRDDMGRWGRLWVENEFSMHASYHRLLTVMKAQGLVGVGRASRLRAAGTAAPRLNLVPKINLPLHPRRVQDPVVVAGTLPAWRAVSGFDHWEGPYPGRKLPRCRWALGPSARFEVDAAHGGAARLLISGRCFEPGQRLKLVQGSQIVGEQDFPPSPPTGDARDRVAAFDITLREGANTFDLHFWKWRSGPRAMAVLVTAITCIPGRRAVAAQVEPKPAPALAR